jgi:crotonobetainyl-CoA:carnitine CoA-transferase CaiB-like acyl-CoA transferase
MVLRETSEQGWDVPMPGVVPRFSRTPGRVRNLGPRLGADTADVLTTLLGLAGDSLGSVDPHVQKDGGE